ncbi:MAG: TatD family hydrolase [Bacilli bacterium]|nr:TatD family hydrolase [Bacilli bacterium]
MFTDTHCHILEEEYDNYDKILSNFKKNNIKRIIINGYNLSSNKEVMQLIDKYPNVYGAIGIHPNYIEDNKVNTIEFIKKNINHPKIIAVGEIGLDYYRNSENKTEQIEVFKEMLELAKLNNKPIIIHNRNATNDILTILKTKKLKGIMHSFSGSIETAIEYIKLGYKLGINGIITFKNSNLSEVISKISLDDILLETDSPYLTPEPIRKERNQPANLIYIAKKISEIHLVDLERLSQRLENNFLKIFDI